MPDAAAHPAARIRYRVWSGRRETKKKPLARL
jgi:hypothetical protein